MRRHGELEVAGKFELTCPQGTVGNLQAAQFDIVFRSNCYIQNGFNSGNPAMDFGPIRSEPDGDLAYAGGERLVGRRPYLIGLDIADVDETTPGIEGRIGSPSRQIEVLPAAVSSAGVRDHQGIASVPMQVNAGRGGFLGPDAIRGVFFGRDVDGGGAALGLDDRETRDRDAFE